MTKKVKKDFPMDVKDSAHKIWLAGLGAVSVAEEEGSKFFKTLVKKGEKFEGLRKKQVDQVVDKMKDGVESRWQRLGDSFDRKVGRAIERLGVPSREEIHKLTQRVEDLTSKIDGLRGKAKAPAKRRKPAAQSTAGRRATARKSA